MFLQRFLILSLFSIGSIFQVTIAQTKVKSAPFTYLPDASDDRYNQRLKQKTLALNETDFAILSKKSASTFAIERYNAELKKIWTAEIALQSNETVEVFSKNTTSVYILTTQKTGNLQQLNGYLFDLKTGKKTEKSQLMQAPASARKLGVSISGDGSKIVAYQYLMQETKIKAINAAIYDENFKKIKERNYSFRDVASNFSVQIRIDEVGNQYVCLLSDNATKLTFRKYNNLDDDVKVMSVPVGGLFDGHEVYVFQTVYQLTQSGILYAAALCLDKKTGDYYSLKLVQCDYAIGEMRFAPEFKFTPEYLAVLNKNNTASKPITRLEDIELSEMLVTPVKDVVLLAEKRYTENGENSNYVAQEIHLFTYDEYMNLAWRSIIMKNQVAAPEDGFSGISYKAHLTAEGLDILTLETLNNKNDLYLRRINTHSGAAELPKALGLNVANTNSAAYIKDFTTWLSDKFIIAVSRPNKKSAGLQLNKLQLKF